MLPFPDPLRDGYSSFAVCEMMKPISRSVSKTGSVTEFGNPIVPNYPFIEAEARRHSRYSRHMPLQPSHAVTAVTCRHSRYSRYARHQLTPRASPPAPRTSCHRHAATVTRECRSSMP